MHVFDLSPNVVSAIGAIVGAAGGFVAARVADVLPRRSGIEPLVTGRPRARRNAALVVLSAAIGAWLAHRLTQLPSSTLVDTAFFFFAVNLVLAVVLLAAAAIDLEHMVLPNELTLGGALLALVTSPFRPLSLVGAAIGVAVGLAITYLPFALYKRLRGRSGMGLGDAKLALVAGAWLGAEGAIFVVFAGAVQAALCATIMRVLGLSFAVPASVLAELTALRARADAGDAEARSLLADDPMSPPADGKTLATMRLPMGPFLVLACLEFLIARREILDVFDRWVAPR
jgi:leader peptidase (prepilin peptidase) / N-methyltransferase